jgi:hypothetical protein
MLCARFYVMLLNSALLLRPIVSIYKPAGSICMNNDYESVECDMTKHGMNTHRFIC